MNLPSVNSTAVMSEQDYYAIERKLKSAIKKAEKKFKSTPILDHKINAGRALKEAREELRQHRLRYYDFVQ
jgi:hypothetical protein